MDVVASHSGCTAVLDILARCTDWSKAQWAYQNDRSGNSAQPFEGDLDRQYRTTSRRFTKSGRLSFPMTIFMLRKDDFLCRLRVLYQQRTRQA